MATKLILVDIDGCLNSGLTAPFDLDALRVISGYVSRLASQNIIVTLCTGRPAPYAQAVAQMLGIVAPLICENGALLLNPLNGEVSLLVSQKDLRPLRGFAQAFTEHPTLSRRFLIEPGKTACLSLTGEEVVGRSPQEIKAAMAQLQTLPFSDQLNWSHSVTAIDVTPLGVNKALGAENLAAHLLCAWSEVAAIGDSYGDISVLKRVGAPMCPANAEEAVKAVCLHISEKQHALGVADLLERFLV